MEQAIVPGSMDTVEDQLAFACEFDSPGYKVDSPPSSSNWPSTQPISKKKWWHVPDVEILDLVQRVGSGSGEQPPQSSALRDSGRPGSESATVRLTVSFSDFAPEEQTGEKEQEDVLDRALRLQSAYHAKPAEPKCKGWWRVSDDKLNEFVQATGYINTGSNVGAASMFNSIVLGPAARSLISPPRNKNACITSDENTSQLSSTSRRSSKGSVNSKLVSRPEWVNRVSSMPNLFAKVGVGLDGKGNKLMKEKIEDFHNTPIYLPDLHDPCLRRVRHAVCGHEAYLPPGYVR